MVSSSAVEDIISEGCETEPSGLMLSTDVFSEPRSLYFKEDWDSSWRSAAISIRVF